MAVSKVTSVFRQGLFAGKSAIVTGGATGIGASIAQELLHLGCKVMIASRKVENLQTSAAKMREMLPPGGEAQLEYLQCNIRKEDEVKNLVSTTLEKFGRLDYLVNNGGGQFISPAADISAKGFHAVVETNLYGTFYCCKEAYNQWMRDNGGVVVNIITDMWKGWPTSGHSGAARAGVDNLTKTLALEWANSGVRVNCVAPGSSIYSPTAAANYGNFNPFAHQVERIPAKRLGTTQEISAAVCFLLSPAASFISGESLKIDGAQVLYCPSLPIDIPNHKNYPTYDWESDLKQQEDQKSKSKL